MRPGITQSLFVELAAQFPYLWQFKQLGTGRDQESNRQLDRRDIVDEVKFSNQRKQIAIAFHRYPGIERNKSWMQRQTDFSKQSGDLDKVFAGVSFVQNLQNAVVDRFNCAGDKQAARVAEDWQILRGVQEMLNLDRDVVGYVWKFSVHGLDDWDHMTGSIEKIRVTEGDVARARFDLIANICQHHVALHDAELSTVHRDNRTMAAQMLAAAACFGITRNARCA